MRTVSESESQISFENAQHEWVRNLRTGAVAPEQPVCNAETISAAIAQVGAEAVQWAVDLGARVADRCIQRLPEFGGGRASVVTLRLGTEQVAIYLLRSLHAGQVVHNASSAETTTMVHDYVHRRVTMDRIWAGMRLGHAWLSEEYMAACRELVERDRRPEELEFISQMLFEYIITYAAEVGDLYRVENAQWIASAQFAREDALRSILQEEDIDEDAVSHTLCYPLSHHHVAFVLKAADDSTTDLNATATELLQSLGAVSKFVIADSETELRAWGGFNNATDARLERSLPTLPGIDAAVGFGGRGAAGFRRAFEEARRTCSIASSLHRKSARILTYNEVSLIGLLIENPEQAADFVERELGKLAEKSSHAEDLRDTVLAYFECRHSPRAAGEKLFVAKNTVIYRLKRAEELIGRSLDERPAEAWAALLVSKALYSSGE